MPSNICSYACSYYNVHQRLEQLTKNILCQNDRHLADIQPSSSVHRSFNPFVHGHSQVCQNLGVSSEASDFYFKVRKMIFHSFPIFSLVDSLTHLEVSQEVSKRKKPHS